MTTNVSYATLYEEWLVRYNEAKDSTFEEAMTVRAARMIPLHAEPVPNAFLQKVLWDMDDDIRLLESELQNFVFERNNDGNLKQGNFADEETSADDFFKAYPEFIREFNKDDVVHFEDEDVEEDYQISTRDQRKGDPLILSSVNIHSSENFNSTTDKALALHDYVSEDTSRQSTRKTQNPYQKYKQLRDPTQPSTHSNTIGSQDWEMAANNHHQEEPMNAEAVKPNPWSSIGNLHNPFQSAADLWYSGEQPESGDCIESTKQYSVAYQQNTTSESRNSLQPAPIQKNIPQSLKRKFQPPKKVSDLYKKREVGGYGQAVRPVSLSEKDVEENDLPGPLKGLDKELVEKIENEILDSGDKVTFDDIAGLEHAKATVQELVCWPMKRPDLFTGLRRGPNGLLLYGPPGTGKTLIGKAVAHESGATFFSISSSSLTSKWIGEGEKLVRTLFAVAAYREPSVVFIDEIDSLLTQRKADENEASRRIKTEFLVQLDGTNGSHGERVLVIGATNRPHELDDAARRRFVKRLYIPLPEAPDREVLIRTLLTKNRHDLTDACIQKLSLATEGFSGADLKALCVEAAMGPLRSLGSRALQVDANDVPPIAYRHFRQSLRAMNPSVSQADLNVYIEWTKTYGSLRMNPLQDDDDSEDEQS